MKLSEDGLFDLELYKKNHSVNYEEHIKYELYFFVTCFRLTSWISFGPVTQNVFNQRIDW